MAVTDFANAAAAVAAGYRQIAVDRGVANPNDKNPAPRFVTVFDKPVTGAAGDSGHRLEAYGESTASAGAADTAAVAAVNAQRKHYYGGSPGRASAQLESQTARGGSHTADLT